MRACQCVCVSFQKGGDKHTAGLGLSSASNDHFTAWNGTGEGSGGSLEGFFSFLFLSCSFFFRFFVFLFVAVSIGVCDCAFVWLGAWPCWALLLSVVWLSLATGDVVIFACRWWLPTIQPWESPS